MGTQRKVTTEDQAVRPKHKIRQKELYSKKKHTGVTMNTLLDKAHGPSNHPPYTKTHPCLAFVYTLEIVSWAHKRPQTYMVGSHLGGLGLAPVLVSEG